MQKKMGLMDLVFMGMGGCIGAGIFSMLGVGIGLTGRSVALAFIIAMIFKMSQQVRMIIMASMFSLSGGMYSQNAMILTPRLTGVSALTTLISSFSFSVFGLSLASYLSLLVPALAPYEKIVACGMLLLFFVIASTGVNIFAKVQNLLGITKILALGLFIVFGLMVANHGGFEGEPYFINGGISFITAIALMSFTCDGISNIVNMAQVTEKPKKNIPKAFILASVACAVIYAALGYVGSSIAPYSEVANQNLGYLAQLVLPPALYIFFVIGGAMASLSTALLGGITGFAPLIAGVAQDGWIPAPMKKLKNVYIVMAIGAILPVIGNFTLDDIVAMIMVPSMVLGIITNYRAMKLPEQYPNEWKGTGLNISPTFYRVMMWVSIVASALTGYFSLTSLTLPLAAGTVVATIFIYIYAGWCLKAGKVDITSTTDLG